MRAPTLPRILLVGVVIATVGLDLVRAAWDQRVLQHDIRTLERRLSAARTDHGAQHARFQSQVLIACEVALDRRIALLEDHGHAPPETP